MNIFLKKSFLYAILLSIICGINYFDVKPSKKSLSWMHLATVGSAGASTIFFTYKAIKNNPTYFAPAALIAIATIGLIPHGLVFGKTNEMPVMPKELKNYDLHTMVPSQQQDNSNLDKRLLELHKTFYKNLLKQPIEDYNAKVKKHNTDWINYSFYNKPLFVRVLNKIGVIPYSWKLKTVSPATVKDTQATLAWKCRCFIPDKIRNNKNRYSLWVHDKFFDYYKSADIVYNGVVDEKTSMQAHDDETFVYDNYHSSPGIDYLVNAAQNLGFYTVTYQELKDMDNDGEKEEESKEPFESVEAAIKHFKSTNFITIDASNNVVMCDYINKHGSFILKNTIVYYINQHKALRTQLTNHKDFKIAQVSQIDIITAVKQAQTSIKDYIRTMLAKFSIYELITINGNVIKKNKHQAWNNYYVKNAFDHIITTFAKKYTIKIANNSSKHRSSATYNPMFAFNDLDELLASLSNGNDAEEED